MTKKIISIILAFSLIFSIGAVTVSAKEKSTPDINEIVGAVKGDIDGVKKSIPLITSLSKKLLRNLQPYIMDVVLTPENIETAVDLGSRLMAKLIDKITNPDEPT